jgi:hypothetical protein
MNLYLFDIGERARVVGRFIGQVRSELQRALVIEKAARKLTQQQIANVIGTSRSVINREITGEENLTLRRVAELAWALGWEIVFELRKPRAVTGQIDFTEMLSKSYVANTSSTTTVAMYSNANLLPFPPLAMAA